jgi:hypothetical protein
MWYKASNERLDLRVHDDDAAAVLGMPDRNDFGALRSDRHHVL